MSHDSHGNTMISKYHFSLAAFSREIGIKYHLFRKESNWKDFLLQRIIFNLKMFMREPSINGCIWETKSTGSNFYNNNNLAPTSFMLSYYVLPPLLVNLFYFSLCYIAHIHITLHCTILLPLLVISHLLYNLFHGVSNLAM